MKKIIVLAFVLLLGGCSTKFAYNNINWLVYWYLDDYIELNSEQEDMFDAMLIDWMKWHRQHELPKYEAQLADIIAVIKSKNISAQSIASHRERAREHWVRARAHVAPDLVELGSTLSQEQIIYLFANLEKQNVEDEEEMAETSSLSKEERVKKWIKRNQKGIRNWLGNLSDEQKNFIATFYDRFESTGSHWLAYRRAYQQQLRQVFAREGRGELFAEKLHELIVNPEQYRPEEFVQTLELNTQASTQYLMGVMEMASDKQIDHLLEEIFDLKDDVVSLQK